jgi:MFS family permease
MLTPYRRVLAVPGALVFSLTGLVGRLPISMVSLGIVILVSGRTGSYTLAGGIAAAYLVGNAVLSVPEGRLVDRLGQSVVLPWTILVFTVALSLMVWSVVAGWPTPVPQVLAALGGAALPPIGSCVRARWSHNVPDKKQLQTAFALEAVVDETVFVVGPILVTVVATAIHPLAGLGTAIAAGLIGTLALSAQRSTQPPAHRGTGRSAPRVPLGWRVLGPLLAAGVTLGVLFGGIEVATVAFADELGAKAASGILLAVYSLGSLLAGVVSGAVRWRASVATRFRRGMAALAVSLVPLPVPGDGNGAVSRWVRDRTHPDRRRRLDRADRADPPAHRGHHDPDHRHQRGPGPRRCGCRPGRRPVRRVGQLLGAPGCRRSRRAFRSHHVADHASASGGQEHRVVLRPNRTGTRARTRTNSTPATHAGNRQAADTHSSTTVHCSPSRSFAR